MTEKATATLNRICHELGVCDSGAILRSPQIKHAAELWKNTSGKVRKVRLALWNDGAITSCEATMNATGKEIEGTCYTTEPGQEEAYWAFKAHLTSPEVGYNVKGIEIEQKV